jgi:predicted small secreted protein
VDAGSRPQRAPTKNQSAFEKGISMRKLIVLAAAAAALMVSACNTIEGAGKDVQSAGKAVTGAARDAKR